MLQAGGPQTTRIQVYRTERIGIQNNYGIYKRTEAWYKRQIGQDRQLGAISPGTVDLTVIFPPVNVMHVLPRGVHAVLLLTSPLEVFYTISTVLVCIDLVRGPH